MHSKRPVGQAMQCLTLRRQLAGLAVCPPARWTYAHATVTIVGNRSTMTQVIGRVGSTMATMTDPSHEEQQTNQNDLGTTPTN